MIIDTNNMTPEQVNVLVNQLLGPIVAALHGNAKVTVQVGSILKEVPICIIDRGQIGKTTRAALDAAHADLKAASNETEKIAALEKLVAAHDVILDGRKEE